MWVRQRNPERFLKTAWEMMKKERFGFDRQGELGETRNQTASGRDHQEENKNNKWKRCYQLRKKSGGRKLSVKRLIGVERRKSRHIFMIKRLKVLIMPSGFSLKESSDSENCSISFSYTKAPDKRAKEEMRKVHDFMFSLYSGRSV